MPTSLYLSTYQLAKRARQTRSSNSQHPTSIRHRGYILDHLKRRYRNWGESTINTVSLCAITKREHCKFNCITVINFRVTGLFAGQYNTKLYGTITDVIYSILLLTLIGHNAVKSDTKFHYINYKQ